ncbi:MAG: hypothetical protein ABIW03_03180 [Sphingomicrobium sp.]
MTRVPKPPNFDDESNRYFLAVYNRAIDEQHHVVLMDSWMLKGLRHGRDEFLKTWEKRGFGRTVVEDDGYGTHTNFSISDNGFAHGKKLFDAAARRRFRARLATNLWPALNGIAALVAAIAATAAAFFSYLALQK